MVNTKVLSMHVSKKNIHLIPSLNKLQILHNMSRAEVVLMLLHYYEFGTLGEIINT